MSHQPVLKHRKVTREELYALVWKTPMCRLSADFAVSGNSLAKICARLDVPVPPRGYWAKKNAGKPVVAYRLSPLKQGVPLHAHIPSTPPVRPVLSEKRQARNIAVNVAETIIVPEATDRLHPKVLSWFLEHKRAQAERAQENRRAGPDVPSSSRPLLADLTERDLYRFQVTSAVFRAVEAAGAEISESSVSGWVTFRVAGHEVACSIVEKICRPSKPPEGKAWTAWPEHHRINSYSSGFLRVTVITYENGWRREWTESEKQKIGDILSEIAVAVRTGGAMLEQRKQNREEADRRDREEELRRFECRRQQEAEEHRWQRFIKLASEWREHAHLLAFIAELEHRLASEPPEAQEAFKKRIVWARVQAAKMNPFAEGLYTLDKRIEG